MVKNSLKSINSSQKKLASSQWMWSDKEKDLRLNPNQVYIKGDWVGLTHH